MNLRKTLFY
ncbi:hypothetical protein YPPY58_2854, partial [Yersinia pestis PY-58]